MVDLHGYGQTRMAPHRNTNNTMVVKKCANLGFEMTPVHSNMLTNEHIFNLMMRCLGIWMSNSLFTVVAIRLDDMSTMFGWFSSSNDVLFLQKRNSGWVSHSLVSNCLGYYHSPAVAVIRSSTPPSPSWVRTTRNDRLNVRTVKVTWPTQTE